MNTAKSPIKSPIVSAWRSASIKLWEAYTDHEFIRSIGDGNLPTAAFMAYLIQDSLFLIHLSRASVLAEVKSESISQLSMTVATVNMLINEEIQLHVKLCADKGIAEEQLNTAIKAPENLACTRYVMDAGLTGDLLNLLTALIPCVFDYHEIAVNLVDDDTLPRYQQWIDAYQADDNKQVGALVSDLIDEVTAAKLGENPALSLRWESPCNRFAIASQLEAEFWQIGLCLAKEPKAASE